jgi:hypothetical protein
MHIVISPSGGGFAPPFAKVALVMSASWILVSAGFMLFPRQFVATITKGRLKLPVPVIWVFRILGLVNMVGAIHFLILFHR